MKITIPELAVVTLVGISGSGKSTFAKKHFKSTEILSSDFFRGLVSDDENNQAVTKEAFEILHTVAAKRLALGKLVVIDATNVQTEARKSLVALAREFHCLPVAIVLNLPDRICADRNSVRADRKFSPQVLTRQSSQLRRGLKSLKAEGFRHIYVLETEAQIADAQIERQPLWNNLKHEKGPFDIIGDIHGCHDELIALLGSLGYSQESLTHAEGRKAVFLGDLCDRGPKTTAVLRTVMQMVRQGNAICVPGNHDIKLMRALKGEKVSLTHGLPESLAQFASEPEEFKRDVINFIDKLISHYVLDDGKLVVAHAGMKESMQGRGSGAVRAFALYGETTGETDEYGLPVRYEWANDYRGKAIVVYGHTPTPNPEWLNNSICIDTGCVFGGRLTALRYPEKQLVSVAANRTYCEPVKPLGQKVVDDEILSIQDLMGKRIIETRLHGNLTIREEQSMAAMEIMSRFGADPQWLIYLPPTMSPPEASRRPDFLEHPEDVFNHFKKEGISSVICEEKHMGSRAIVIVCRDADVARKRFDVKDGTSGIIYTRTGRRFFDPAQYPNYEAELLSRLRGALDRSRAWDELSTDWICLDCELMPWSAKAQELLVEQYAAAGAAGSAALSATLLALENSGNIPGISQLTERITDRRKHLERFRTAYRAYCWDVSSVSDLKLAPFHILATEGAVHGERDHLWHMETIQKFCTSTNEPTLFATPYRVVDLNNPEAVAAAIGWWHAMTERGGEGMVVKPLGFTVIEKNRLIQPAMKCRGPEYLRIIYGPEYMLAENLSRLRQRNTVAKRSLAVREFALGIEGLERFVRKEPLRSVHECALAVLALESDPVDPRL